ncbi:hypothetical protein [Rhodoferax aquaticus]|uniref:Uncharacterized protein n=1 Tax=Rhodoferax aquaticus TaxID=2527691 RepID=A0A515EJD4_9BURK|nr:hypothetical protein [Rhodoferax aquaticus]QDL52787.1 hypothetical protein EXZ61_00565 [Rhodoferax aquaticus]
MTDDERFAFCHQLQEQLKPKNFWVTDFLAVRLMEVEFAFCNGESANSETILLCAKFCEELLYLKAPDAKTLSECMDKSTISAAAKSEVDTLLTLSQSTALGMATTAQACAALSGFFHLVFTRRLPPP